MRTLAIVSFVGGLLFALHPGMTQQPAQNSEDTAQNESQQQCARRAAEIWKTEYGSRSIDPVDNARMSYENHYSRTLNKCFFLEISDSPEYEHTEHMERLFDANDDTKKYGSFWKRTKTDGTEEPIIECDMGDHPCRSEAEWKVLLKPYMED